MQTKSIRTRGDADTLNRINEIANRRGKSRSAVIKETVGQHPIKRFELVHGPEPVREQKTACSPPILVLQM